MEKTLSLRQVNSFLWRGGMDRETRLCRGRGYYYFWGEETPDWYTSSVMTMHLSDLTPEQWLAEYHRLKEEHLR